jgi:SAM-dependent methyltransferase
MPAPTSSSPLVAKKEDVAEEERPRPRRDSVVVRGTVRVSDAPGKRRAAEEAPERDSSVPPEAPAAGEAEAGADVDELENEPTKVRIQTPEARKRGRASTEEIDLASVEIEEETGADDVTEEGAKEPAAKAVPPPAPAPDRSIIVDPSLYEPDIDVTAEEDDAIPGERTMVTDSDAPDEVAPAAVAGASVPVETAEPDVPIDDATDDDEMLGLGSDELDLDIDEEAPSDDEDEAEELETEAIEEIDDVPKKPRSHPPPMPPGETPGEPLSARAPVDAVPPEAPPAEAVAQPAPESRPRRRRKPWWEDFFNDDYLRTVRPSPARYVKRQCDFIEAQLGLERGATILDVGCGLGLHAVELAARGYLVVGLDLSLPMLSRAADEAQDRGLKINFLHGDMREMTFDGAFDAVLCWGTTLGYFDEDTNRRVIERLYRALKPMGLLLMDVVNRDHVIRFQPNLVWFEGDGCVCMEETQFNYITSRLEVKRTVILDDGRQRENPYSIRLYALNEIGYLLHLQGFRVASVSGLEAHPGVFFGGDSPRMIIMAERRLAKGGRDTPKDGTDRLEKPPVPPASGSGTRSGGETSADAEEPEEIAELEIEPEPETQD